VIILLFNEWRATFIKNIVLYRVGVKTVGNSFYEYKPAISLL